MYYLYKHQYESSQTSLLSQIRSDNIASRMIYVSPFLTFSVFSTKRVNHNKCDVISNIVELYFYERLILKIILNTEDDCNLREKA